MPRTVDNPPNRFERVRIEHDPDAGDAPLAALEVYEETARSIVSENDSPDIPYRYGVNPYRGCYHACAYCYARTTHTFLGFGSGTDFDRRIVAKVNAPALLREAFERPGWSGEEVVLSGVTDCYQPLEAKYKLTRGCLEVCAEYRNPVGIITKNALIERDIDVLQTLARTARVEVFVSIPFADDETARVIEPNASTITRRLQAVRALADAGISVGVSLAPIIPGLNDTHIPKALERAWEAGARRAFMQMVRLAPDVLPVFDARIEELGHARAEHVRSSIRAVRGGAMDNGRFGMRMRGEGPRWKLIEDLFAMQCKRLGFNAQPLAPRESTFQRPREQLTLFKDMAPPAMPGLHASGKASTRGANKR